MDLQKHFTAILEDLLARGFEPPIHIAVLAANGSVLAGSFTGTEFKPSAQCYFGAGFQLPINMMFVDGATGAAARVVIEKPDQIEYTIN